LLALLVTARVTVCALVSVCGRVAVLVALAVEVGAGLMLSATFEPVRVGLRVEV
jgi:hypothetical protein